METVKVSASCFRIICFFEKFILFAIINIAFMLKMKYNVG